MEKLKLVLICVVALLGAAVAYGYIDDGGGETTTPSPADRPSPVAAAPNPSPGSEGDGVEGAEPDLRREGKSTAPPAAGGEDPDPGKPTDPAGSEGQAGGSGKPGGTRSEGAAPDGGAVPAKSEYVASVDAICGKLPSRFAARAQKAAAKAGKQGAEAIEGVYRRAIVRTLNQTAREIDALTPPAGDEQEVAALVAAMEKAIGRIEERRVDALTETSVLTEFAKRSKRYGLDRCSQF